ncbi:HlyD family efflux transporter periplasmic adaptor subunit [Limnohabitans sp.]|jgi:adhesin transport system membrane fusion protein|uniref:HlyD family efflux transporter periplasmic adaptor subunit n=1 Tax=Limnohabitans sp. TaxID=1907725 RepID=UPI0025C33BF8|nr:HlyD family efflux transporter periplasmic adaptor subunit [Limnohabitans sp.]
MNAPRVATPQAPAAEQQALMRKILRLRSENQAQADLDLVDDVYAATLRERQPAVRWGLYSTVLVLLVFVAWAAWAQLEEVTTGSGKVIPTSREQVIQSLESGVLAEIMVSEGDTVEADQPLLRIDDVRQGASVKEGQSKVDALLAAAARLRAESQGGALVFPAEVQRRAPELIRNERETFEARRRSLDASLGAQQQALRLAQDELRITEPMAAGGYVSDVEVLRIKRTLAEAKGRIAELSGKFRAEAAAELARVESELAGQRAGLTSREDTFRRTVLRAPKRGVVKNIRINTLGGVIQPGQDLLEIIPMDDSLLIETRIRPSDIAFLRPGMEAIVKVTAYDSAVYGWLPAKLVQISPDTLRDEVRRDETYYRALVRTDAAALKTPDGKSLPIIPGMLAQVDIKTGQKSVLSYVFKPVLRAREALRER